MAVTAKMSDARWSLRHDFDFPAARAKNAVTIGAGLVDTSISNTPLGYLAGVKMTATQSSTVLSLLPGATQIDGASSDVLSHTAVLKYRKREQLGRLARKTAKSEDRPSFAVCAALLASQREDADSGRLASALRDGLAHTFMGPKKPSKVQRAADRILSVAYAMSSLSKRGLDLGSDSWTHGSDDWRFHAAPWLLPLLDSSTSPALVDLLNVASARGLKFVRPGQSPFTHADSRDVTEDTRSLAVGNAASLTKWIDWPIWFGGGPGEVQVLLTQDEEYAYAWVGRNGRGQLVAFDTTDFIGWGLDEPGMVQSLAYAIGWYVDVSISLRASQAGTTTLQRTGTGSARRGISFKPTKSYATQRSGVAQRRHNPPIPHMVASHVRDLKDRNPSAEALSHAPRKFRTHMGPHETWVRSHPRGAGAASHQQVEIHLGKNSALADVIGLVERAASGST